MDLRLGTVAASSAERAAVASVLGPAVSRWEGGTRADETEGHVAYGGHEARSRRHLLLPVLRAVQERVGWISEPALDHICERLTIARADVYGVATFYGLLTVEPRAPRVIHVCEDLACKCAGSDELASCRPGASTTTARTADMWLFGERSSLGRMGSSGS